MNFNDYISYLSAFLVFLYISKLTLSDCSMLNNCNGHGTCIDATSSCSCFEGWGALTDITFYYSPDCSARICPSGKAWADVPSSSTTAHALAECSNRGSCDRTAGTCTCFTGFSGPSCNKINCPNDCSGHGVCVSIKEMAQMYDITNKKLFP